MELPILSKIKIAVFIPEEPPREYLEKWRDSMKKAAPKMRLNLKKAISGIGDYSQKIAKSTIKEFIELLNQGYLTKTGKKYEQIINKMLTEIKKSHRKYAGKTKKAFARVGSQRASRFIETIDDKAYIVALRQSQLVLPFSGYKDIIRGAGPFAARWLSGDSAVMKLMTKQDNCYGTKPVSITKPEKSGEFRNKFVQQISKSGARIVQYNYSPEIIRQENKAINELVNQCSTKGFKVSIDFSTENNLLYLAIEVS
ncbi:MAG: hypothetical protein HY811_05390 [Planctomycetes bacterium]|nr:hypothetical protein [Planctomycetota bacterium]